MSATNLQGHTNELHPWFDRPRKLRALLRRWAGVILTLPAAWCLTGCALPPAATPEPLAAWVQWADTGRNQLRVASTAGAVCPTAWVDGHPVQTIPRVASSARAAPQPAAVGQRTPMDVSVCELELAGAVRDVRVGSRRLPVPAAKADRIVILGDTGCRLSDTVWQACNDAAAWPFARVAAAAAAMRPDLVIHVGDYHYRERPCPAGEPGCAGSSWGYGWDAWRADFFVPAAPLLAVAPWVFVRGNHEECARAGQGWFRLLAAESYDSRRACDDPGQDAGADFTPPYAVPLGDDLQLIVFDSSRAGNTPLDLTRPEGMVAYETYARQSRMVSALASRPGVSSWFSSHHPVLGFAPRRGNAPFPGNPVLQQALRDMNGTAYFPAGVGLALHGHVHLFQALSFVTGQPPTLVAGNAGDTLDQDLTDDGLAQRSPAPGVVLAKITHASHFGFLLMERERSSDRQWRMTAFRVDGGIIAICRLAKAMECTKPG